MKGYRTIAVNVLALAGFALGWPQLSEVVNPQYVSLALAAVNLALRFVTNTPVGSRI